MGHPSKFVLRWASLATCFQKLTKIRNLYYRVSRAKPLTLRIQKNIRQKTHQNHCWTLLITHIYLILRMLALCINNGLHSLIHGGPSVLFDKGRVNFPLQKNREKKFTYSGSGSTFVPKTCSWAIFWACSERTQLAKRPFARVPQPWVVG